MEWTPVLVALIGIPVAVATGAFAVLAANSKGRRDMELSDREALQQLHADQLTECRKDRDYWRARCDYYRDRYLAAIGVAEEAVTIAEQTTGGRE